MGFHVEINNILRSDTPAEVAPGQSFDFKKEGSRIFCDDIPIWLTHMDWTAVAEIEITSQTHTPKEIHGQFRVLHVYSGNEQEVMTSVFRRMFAPDPFFYLLESKEILDEAMKKGFLVRDDLIKEGFIHASPADQLTRVANKYYRAVKDLRCAMVAKKKVLAQIKYEPATGGVYPHIYGPLNMNAVERIIEIHPGPNGDFNIDIGGLPK